jgi:predicted dehydrogenase
VKELVESGAIGKARFVSISLRLPPGEDGLAPDDLPWRVIPEIAGGGRFFDLGSHQLDLLDYIFGSIISVKGLAANQADLYPAEDIVCASFAFESGVLGSGVWCFSASEQDRVDRTEIVGSAGRIVYATFAPEPVRLETDAGVKEIQFALPKHIQRPLIQTVVDDLQGQGKCPSTGITAARTNNVMDQVIAEYRLASLSAKE